MSSLEDIMKNFELVVQSSEKIEGKKVPTYIYNCRLCNTLVVDSKVQDHYNREHRDKLEKP